MTLMEQHSYTMTDVFPDLYPPIDEDYRGCTQSKFENVMDAAVPFMSYKPMNRDSVTFIPLGEDAPLLKMHQRRLKVSSQRRQEIQLDRVSWARIVYRLEKDPHFGHRMPSERDNRHQKNTDIRMNYRWNSMFLVKNLFTFGLRQVPAGERHVLTTTSSEMLVFLPKNPRYVATLYQPGRLVPSDMRHFDCFRLKGDSRYAFEENCFYLLLAPLKTLFSLERFQSYRPFSYPLKDPREERVEVVDKSEDEKPRSKKRKILEPPVVKQEVLQTYIITEPVNQQQQIPQYIITSSEPLPQFRDIPAREVQMTVPLSMLEDPPVESIVVPKPCATPVAHLVPDVPRSSPPPMTVATIFPPLPLEPPPQQPPPPPPIELGCYLISDNELAFLDHPIENYNEYNNELAVLSEFFSDYGRPVC